MSIRLIACMGVALCVAMTAFSIYLGIAEHAYQQPRTHIVALATPHGRELLCFSVQVHRTTTTSANAKSVERISCTHAASRS